MKFLVQSSAELRSAFEGMMVARKFVRLPSAMEGTLSKKDDLYNHVRGVLMANHALSMAPHRSGRRVAKCFTMSLRRIFVDSW